MQNAPTPAWTYGTTLPTAGYLLATAAPHSPVFGSTATIENVAVIDPAEAGAGRADFGAGAADGLAEIVTRTSSSQARRVVVWSMMLRRVLTGIGDDVGPLRAREDEAERGCWRRGPWQSNLD